MYKNEDAVTVFQSEKMTTHMFSSYIQVRTHNANSTCNQKNTFLTFYVKKYIQSVINTLKKMESDAIQWRMRKEIEKQCPL